MEKEPLVLKEITKDYMPECEGKYLVRTVSTGPSKSVLYLQARVSKNFNQNEQKWSYSIDVSNQTPTHISNKPLEK